jgi:hypothetical protein
VGWKDNSLGKKIILGAKLVLFAVAVLALGDFILGLVRGPGAAGQHPFGTVLMIAAGVLAGLAALRKRWALWAQLGLTVFFFAPVLLGASLSAMSVGGWPVAFILTIEAIAGLSSAILLGHQTVENRRALKASQQALPEKD